MLCRLGRRTRADVKGQDSTLVFSNSWGLGEDLGDGLAFFEGGLEVFDDFCGEDVGVGSLELCVGQSRGHSNPLSRHAETSSS